MREREITIERWVWTIVVAANAVLFILILASPHYPIYDERYYLEATKLLDTEGFSRKFLLEYPGSAGPLHTIVYEPLVRLFGLAFPYLRLLSFALLLASAWLLSRVAGGTVLACPLPHHVRAGLIGAIFTVVPSAAVSAGMTLTEMPAVLFLNLSLLLLACTLSASSLGASITFAAAAGLTIGIAVLGRQTYLIVLPCLLMLLISDTRIWTRGVLSLSVFCVVTGAVVAPTFLVWGGLVPPKFAAVDEGVSPWHGVLAMGYAGLIGFLITPEIVRGGKWYLLAVVTIATAIWSLTRAPFMPMHTALPALVGQAGAALVASFFGWAVSLVATYFVCCFSIYLWSSGDNRTVYFLGLAALVGFISSIKITHQFNSRYVFVFLPLLLLSLAPKLRLTWHLPVRVAAGACISLISAASYLLLTKP
jgi:hypothetical protein